VFVALGAGDPKGTRYTIVLDSAFGLVKGADFKVGGVPVGSISDLDVRRSDARALVEVEVSEGGAGFGGLRDDATCIVTPQSLIGEYFVDCQPGENGELLDSGATIPVEQTKSPIPPDLVLNVMREPVRERMTASQLIAA
jgi:ABC-type transporter Mla subunit MlaD